MKTSILGLIIVLFTTQASFAQRVAEQELIDLSKQKWQWMADKNVDELATLFHDKSKLYI